MVRRPLRAFGWSLPGLALPSRIPGLAMMVGALCFAVVACGPTYERPKSDEPDAAGSIDAAGGGGGGGRGGSGGGGSGGSGPLGGAGGTVDAAPDVRDSAPDTGSDASPDAGQDAIDAATDTSLADAAVDASLDVAVDRTPDRSPDLTPDVAPDQSPDVAPDLAPDQMPDRTPDTSPDLPPDAPPGTPGFFGEYFNNKTLTAPSRITRYDATIDFDWGMGSPDITVGANGFSVRWSGRITPPQTATYTFYVASDEGARLWVDGMLIIDDWAGHASVQEKMGNISLQQGQGYDIRLEYFENTGAAQVRLSWSRPSQPKTVVPASAVIAGAPTDGGVVDAAGDANVAADLAPVSDGGTGLAGATGHWPLDEGSGLVTADLSGNANSGALTGFPASGFWSTDTRTGMGRALVFNGSTSQVSVPSSASLDGVDIAFTISAWVKRTANLSRRALVVSRQSGNTPNKHYAFGFDNDQLFLTGTKIGIVTNATVADVPLNTWVHVAAVYDGANLTLYVNGQVKAVAGRTGSGVLTADTTPLVIGNGQGSAQSEAFNGLIDEVRIYPRALALEDIQALAQ